MVSVDADYCPTCGGELGRRAFEGRRRRYCHDCERFVWRNPVPTAGVVVRDRESAAPDGTGDDAVLLARRAADEGPAYWTVPGGFMEHDESAPAAAVRELAEETGVEADPEALTLLATHHHESPRLDQHNLLLRYVVDRADAPGEPTPGSDVDRARFVAADDLDDYPMRPHNRRFVRLALAGEGADR